MRWLPQWLGGKESTCNAGVAENTSLIPGLGRSPGGVLGYPLQYSCLENPMNKGAWQDIVPGVTKSQTWLKWLGTHTHTHSYNLSIYMYICIHVYICTYICIYVHIYVYTHTHTHTHIYIHTLINIHTQLTLNIMGKGQLESLTISKA